MAGLVDDSVTVGGDMLLGGSEGVDSGVRAHPRSLRYSSRLAFNMRDDSLLPL